MNCRQGDLALVLHGGANSGKIVTCLRMLPAGYITDIRMSDGRRVQMDPRLGPLWEVDRMLLFGTLFSSETGTINIAADKCLMPIRPEPDEETEERVEELAT